MEGHYKGETRGGVREGKGELEWTNGDVYTGEFHNGLRHGQGTLNLFRLNNRTGIFKSKRGIQYEGGWRISRRHGDGSQEWPNGERYHGEWRDDVPEGRGTWLRRGGRYAGDLKEGVRHGKGILKLRGGGEYDGQWVRGRMSGYGVYLWPDARIYKGSWQAGLRHGEGTMTFPSGERFTGQWKEGRKYGQGMWRWSNGRTRRGEWHNDQLVQWTSAEAFGEQPRIPTKNTSGQPNAGKKGNTRNMDQTEKNPVILGSSDNAGRFPFSTSLTHPLLC